MKKFSFLLSDAAKLYIPITALLGLGFAMGPGGQGVLWGVHLPQDPSTVPIRAFFQWQMLTLPPLLLASDHLSNEQAMEVFLRMRMKNDQRRFFAQIIPCVAGAFVWSVILSFLAWLLEPVEPLGQAAMLTILGQMMWTWMYLAIYFAARSVPVALVGTILLMGGLFYIGELLPPAWRFLPPTWSMVSRCFPYEPLGVPVETALLGCIGVSVICALICMCINQIKRAKI